VTELSTGKVMVTGTMDGDKLVDYVYRRTKKQARIVPQPEPEPEKKEENKEAEKPAEEAKPEEKPAEEAKKEEGNNNGESTENKEEKGGEESKEEGKKEGGENGNSIDEEGMKRMMYYYQPLYVIERIPPPQLFSDENPNACCIS
jgi:Mg-chelatase subunit ChlI